eukprot:185299_1
MASANENHQDTNNSNSNNNNNNNNNGNQYVSNNDLAKLNTIVDYITNLKKSLNFHLPEDTTVQSQIIHLINDISIDFNTIRKLEAVSTEAIVSKTMSKLWKLVRNDIKISIMETLAFVPHLLINNIDDNNDDNNDEHDNDDNNDDKQEEKNVEKEMES